MYKLLMILLIIPVISNAQSKGGYFSIRGGYAVKNDLKKGIAHLSIGVSPNHTFGVGAGVGFIDFDKPYIPLTCDISFFGKPDKVSPVVIGSAGYGVYKYVTPYYTEKGGFTGSLNIGASLPLKKYTKLFFTVGYSIYNFNGGQNIYTTSSTYKSENSVKMYTLTAGIKI